MSGVQEEPCLSSWIYKGKPPRHNSPPCFPGPFVGGFGLVWCAGVLMSTRVDLLPPGLLGNVLAPDADVGGGCDLPLL